MSLSTEQLTKPLKVARRIAETADAVSLVLEIPAELSSQFRYQAGQFVTFFMTIDGQAVNRSYSLSSSPLVDREFKITVKKVPGGKGSTFLCDKVKEGDTLLTTPPAGHFFKPTLSETGTHYYLFAAGSGITPLYSILKTVLNASSLNQVTLVYCNRDQNSVIYARELEVWQTQFPARLHIEHVFSKPQGGWTGLSGRLQPQLIADILKRQAPKSTSCQHYLCGPREFMTMIKESLRNLGFSKDQIHEEDFGVGLTPTPSIARVDNANWTLIGDEGPSESPEKIVATVNGETVEIAARSDISILEALLESGAQPPYSCLTGSCMACIGKIQEGKVYQEDPGILTDDNIVNRECLTCQAKPLSRIVKVSYDNL